MRILAHGLRFPKGPVALKGGSVQVVEALGGRLSRVLPDFRVEARDPLTTNICFGGPDGRTAYAPLGTTGRLAVLDWDVPGLPLAF